MSAPTKTCPYCGEECEAQFTDVGVGEVQTSPYGCDLCHAVEIGPFDYPRKITTKEKELGWYHPEYEVSLVYPPIPDRNHDWMAFLHGEDEEGIRGWGKTKKEALIDLLNQVNPEIELPDSILEWDSIPPSE